MKNKINTIIIARRIGKYKENITGENLLNLDDKLVVTPSINFLSNQSKSKNQYSDSGKRCIPKIVK